MTGRRYLFPNVIELNRQAGHRIGVNVYLVEDAGEFVLIDVGYEDAVDEIVDLVRQMDFPMSACKLLVATHADVDHSQGLAKAKEIFKAPVGCHPSCADDLASGDKETTFARIRAQGIDITMPKVRAERMLKEGDVIEVGSLKLQVWNTPGHAPGQLAFKLRNLLFVGDNIYKDGSVGVIDAHHGSHLPDFVASLKRIKADDAEYWLPSHGPVFKRDDVLIQSTIDRLTGYQHLADFGTCAVDWPLLSEWDQEIAEAGAGMAATSFESDSTKKNRLKGALS
jgi:hydroxyacylglutathione hydrolase